MPRSRLQDLMQIHRFWLLDVVPSATFPFYVLGSPILAFQSVSLPEYTFEVEEVREINSMFKRRVYAGGDVGPVTLTRGVRGWDDSMWQWTKRAMRGIDSIPRTLLLLQFMGIRWANPDLPVPLEAWEGVAFVPGKAWVLYDAIPTRYKPGTDLDAGSGAVSIAELEVQPWAMTEITFVSKAAALA